MTNTPKRKWTTIILTLVILAIVSYITAGVLSLILAPDYSAYGNVALIKVEGMIVGGGIKPALSQSITSSDDVIHFIKSADNNPSVKAIVLEINSGGGTAVGSKEIADAVKRTNKTTLAVIREIGTSGAYWVASATDEIIANDLSMTGSIGVISSYLEFSGFFDKYGVKYNRLVAGKYKDIGSPFKDMTTEEELLLQRQLDKIHQYFITQVAENRGLDPGHVSNISTGMFYLGIDAKEYGLVDHLGDLDTAKEIIQERLNLTEVLFSEYKKAPTFLDVLSRVFSEQSFHVGQGIGDSFVSGASSGIMT
ncbi:signal peptide peptidase SppA [Nanoarchaeota archaeon]